MAKNCLHDDTEISDDNQLNIVEICKNCKAFRLYNWEKCEWGAWQ